MSRAHSHVDESFGGWHLDTHGEIDGDRAAVYTHSESKIRVACIPMDGDRGWWRVEIHPPADIGADGYVRLGFKGTQDGAEHLAKTEMNAGTDGYPPALNYVESPWGQSR